MGGDNGTTHEAKVEKTESNDKPQDQLLSEAFAGQFEPPLRLVQVDQINNVPRPGAWMGSYWDGNLKIGITALFHNGQIHAHLEMITPDERIAETFGRLCHQALEALKKEQS